MSQDNSPQPASENRLTTALIAFIRTLIRLLAIVVAGALIGGAIFYGVPILYRQYIHPVQQTITRLNDTQAAQELTIQQLNQRIDRLDKRIEVLQIQSDKEKQTNADLASSIESVTATQIAIDESLQTMQTSSSTSLDEIKLLLDKFNLELTNLQRQLDKSNQQTGALATQIASTAVPINDLKRELQLLKVMELLTRSRLYLVENNLGLVVQDLNSAVDILEEIQKGLPTSQDEWVYSIIQRLELAQGYLPEKPLLAAQDLEVAWQLLRDGFPQEPHRLQALEITQTSTPWVASATQTPTSTMKLSTPSTTSTP